MTEAKTKLEKLKARLKEKQTSEQTEAVLSSMLSGMMAGIAYSEIVARSKEDAEKPLPKPADESGYNPSDPPWSKRVP